MDSEDDYTTTLDLINVPILSQQERQDIFSQDSYDSQTQTQTQTQKIAQPPIKFEENQWGLLRNLQLPQYQDYYCTLPNRTISFGRHKNNNYIIKGNCISSMHFQLHLKKNEITKQYFVEIENNSKNGTSVNSITLHEHQSLTLSNNDIISLSKESNQTIEFLFALNPALNVNADSIFNKYEFKRFLGSGSFSTVKEAVRKSDGSQFAVKIIDSNKFYFNEKAKQGFKREIDILKKLDHKNIIKFSECIEEEGKIYIVTELMKGGSLLGLIERKNGLPEIEARILFKQILEGIKYLHDRNITHRDIKPDNILLEIEKCSNYDDSYSQSLETANDFKVIAKISDFGLAKNDNYGLQTVCGTPQYLAPEIMNESSSNNFYDSKVDCWSLGVVLFQMISNLLPHKNGRKSVIDFSNNIWTRVSFSVIHLIENLLVVDKNKRYSVDQALNHSWFVMENKNLINDPYLNGQETQNWAMITYIDNNETHTLNLDTDIVLIGANRRCTVMLTDISLSQLHLIFFLEGNTAYLVDKSISSNNVYINGNVVEKNKSIILNSDCIIKIADSDDKEYRIEFDIIAENLMAKANKVKKPQVIIPSRPSNPRKRKFSNDSKMIERSKRSSTVKVNSEIRSSPHDFTSKKIDVIFNGNQYLEPTFANLSLSNDDIWLELIPFDKHYKSLLIKENEFTIGRHRKCLVVIDDMVVSNYHLDIIRDDSGKVMLRDKSSNGTYINHVKVRRKTVQLNNNDKIILIYQDYDKPKDDNNIKIGYTVSLK